MFGRARIPRLEENARPAMMRRRAYAAASPAVVLAVLAVLLSIGGAGAAAGCRPPAQTHQVVIEGVAYAPAAITVHAGDTIVWTNKDPFPHTVTSQAAAFDSTAIQPGGTWQYVAKSIGTFEYTCTFHPTMKGMLTVQ